MKTEKWQVFCAKCGVIAHAYRKNMSLTVTAANHWVDEHPHEERSWKQGMSLRGITYMEWSS